MQVDQLLQPLSSESVADANSSAPEVNYGRGFTHSMIGPAVTVQRVFGSPYLYTHAACIDSCVLWTVMQKSPERSNWTCHQRHFSVWKTNSTCTINDHYNITFRHETTFTFVDSQPWSESWQESCGDTPAVKQVLAMKSATDSLANRTPDIIRSSASSGLKPRCLVNPSILAWYVAVVITSDPLWRKLQTDRFIYSSILSSVLTHTRSVVIIIKMSLPVMCILNSIWICIQNSCTP